MKYVKVTDYFNDSDKVVSVNDIITIDGKGDYEVVQLAASKAFTLMKCDTCEVYEHLGIKQKICKVSDIKRMFGMSAKLKNAGAGKKLMSGTVFRNACTRQVYMLTYDTTHNAYAAISLYNGVLMYKIASNSTDGINVNNYKEFFGYAADNMYIVNSDQLTEILDSW